MGGSISTGAGDGGATELGGGERVPKDHPRIEALGALDELNAFLGEARTLAAPETAALLRRIQGDLIGLSATLAVPGREGRGPDAALLEGWIREREASRRGSPPGDFVLPGENPGEAKLHLARTVCRRAERRLVSLDRLEGVPAPLLRYLNRLSDLLFLLASPP